MPTNNAAWLVAEKAIPLEVKEAPYPTPSENEILVRNHAVAVNPVETYIQRLAFFPLTYPIILGQDISGEVVAVGPSVTRFKAGDRVLGHASGMLVDKLRESAFQEYTIVQSHMATEIPDDIPFEKAVVVPLGLSTSACALFQAGGFLDMQWPTEPAQRPTGKSVLIWGGSSSVGSNGIQLSIAAGYDVIITASAKNHEYVKKLGASQVFDYNSPTVIDDIVTACKGKTLVGALDCIGGSAADGCQEVMRRVEDGNRIVATVKPVKEAEGVSTKHIFGLDLLKTPLGPHMYNEYLPKALKSGSYVPAPEPLIVGKGLEKMQEAFDILWKGVSAAKVVVLL